uniref:Polycystin cation channel PKD1/PKD2 domain-containing protein n=2 Tax=Palpitomonas bilix TaxID=652834 RepID=A0A7S3CW78_9EUKA|mmetsp:Transcript_11855/g.32059  ORF Transcript_11855/g.32059 Transcript_11855/m.32059 type:complete len:1070 (+) Transcript_11855:130-3339(+)
MLPNATVAAMMQKRREEEEGVRDSDEEEEGHLDDDRSGAISARRPKTPANRDDGLTTVMPSAPISSIDLKHLRDRLAYLTSPEEAYVVEKVLKDWRAEHRGKAKLLAAQDTVAGETVASPRSELQATRLTEWYRKEKGRKQLEKVKESLKKQGELKVNYLNLFGFMIFTALYMAILVLQKNPTTAFQIENSLIEATFSGDSGLLDANEELYPDVGAPSELFKWLRTAVVSTTFVDSSCGNGKCEAPDEFQGYEDFGCESDCGLYPNLTTVTIELTPDSNFAQTSWNIFAYHMGDDIFSAYKTLTSTDPYTYTASVPDGSYQFELRDTAGNGGAAGTLSVGGTEILSWPSSYPLQQYDHCDMRQWPSSWFTNIKQNCVSLCYLNNSNTQYTQPCDDMNTCTTACRNAVLAIKDRVLECTTEGFMHVDMDSLSSAYSVGTYAEQIYLFTQECFSENPFDPGTCTNEYCSNGPIGAQGCDVGCFTQQCDWKMDGCADLDTRSYGPTDDSDLLYDTSATGEGEEGEAGGPSPPVSNFDPMRYVNFVNFINSISDSVLIPSNDCNSPDGFGEVIEQIEEMTAGNKAYTFNVYNNWGGCTPYTSALTVPFDVYNYNANGTVLNLRDLSDSKVRYIGEKNRLLGGIFINQKRAKEVNCTTRFTSIDSTCVSDYEYDTEEYSVDPVFIGTSSLYDAFVSRSNFYSDQEISASGTPYAFFHSFVNPDGSIYTGIADTSNLSTTENPFGVNIHSSSASHSMSGFHAIFDNDLSQSQSSSYLQFLEDGFFLDEYTTELEVFYCTYNFEHGLLTTMKVMWYPEKGGRIKYRHIIQSIPFEPYRNTAGLVRLGLELVFVALLVFTIISELTDCIKAKKEGGSPLDYFKQVSNLFDIVSIIAMLAMCVLWIVIVLKVNSITLQTDFGVYRYQGENARPQTRYASTSLTKARFFEYDASNHAQFVTFISDISTLAGYNEAYVVLGGMNILLLVFRILKLMHFQARMGLLTRTLSHAATDLFHFIVLFMVTFVGFSFMSFILFGHQVGSSIDPSFVLFRTVSQPHSILFCFVPFLFFNCFFQLFV